MEFEIISKMLDGENPETFFEVGCGSGGLSDRITGGLDLKPGKAHFMEWNAEKIPWPLKDNSQDIVFTVGTLLLIPDPYPIIKEMLRICKDKIIIAEVQDDSKSDYGEARNFITQEVQILDKNSKQPSNFYDSRIARDYKKVFKNLGLDYQLIDGVGGKTIFKCKKM